MYGLSLTVFDFRWTSCNTLNSEETVELFKLIIAGTLPFRIHTVELS